MSKEAASRSLDYRLRTDTLDRLKGAAQAGQREEGDIMPGEGLMQVGQAAGAAIQQMDALKKADELAQKVALDAFDKAIDNLGTRQGAYSTNTWEQSKMWEENLREQYLAADKETQAKMLREMGDRHASIQGIKEQITILEEAINPQPGEDGIVPPSGLDRDMLVTTEAGRVINEKITELLNQENTTLKYDEDNQAYFEYGDPPQQIYRKDVTEFIEMAAAPATEAAGFMDLITLTESTAAVMPEMDANQPEDFALVEEKKKDLKNEASNWVENSITEENAWKMMNSKDVFQNNKKSFRDILYESAPLWEKIFISSDPKKLQRMDEFMYDIDGDGDTDVDDGEIILTLEGDDRKRVIDMLMTPEHIDKFKELVQGYIEGNIDTKFNAYRAVAPKDDRMIGTGSFNKKKL